PEPAFETPEMMEKVWGRSWGLNNDVGHLRTVLVSPPGPELNIMLEGGEYAEEFQGWIGPDYMWYWADKNRPDVDLVRQQHINLVSALEKEGVEVVNLENPLPTMTKSIFTRDPAIMTQGGAIVCRFGIAYRRGEELPITRTLANLGVPILHTIHGTGLMEGGSFAWLNETTAVVGIGHRCNFEGARQLGEVLKTQGVELLQIDNMGYGLHIDGSFLMVDTDMALAFSYELPWWFLEHLKKMGIRVVEADPRDGPFGVNCLAVSPGRVIMAAHAERTADKLDALGVTVIPVDYGEIHKGGGGVHCSTLPLIRDDL
ncbi:MAG: arginine deiminase family protein, partial [Chloroflexota bacterium]